MKARIAKTKAKINIGYFRRFIMRLSLTHPDLNQFLLNCAVRLPQISDMLDDETSLILDDLADKAENLLAKYDVSPEFEAITPDPDHK
jgi:hypothetical protein